tara:strand:+ start:202521 stop:203822 length:1302 start_codon:yes stop_codon:yes gene_type:complete
MPIRAALTIVLMFLTTHATAQQFWLVQKLFLPNSVDTHDIGRSFASGNGRVYIGGAGSLGNGTQPSGVYEFNENTLEYIRRFSGTGNTLDNRFGWDMEFHNGLLLVGAPQQDTTRGRTGAAYLFNAGSGAIVKRFEAFDGQSLDLFGSGVSLHGIIALVGSPFANSGVAGTTGKVYVYRTDSFANIIALTASTGSNDRDFGLHVKHNDQYAVVTAQNDITEEGVVYVFDFVTGAVLHRFTSPNARSFDGFGGSLALDGDTLVVGAQRGSTNQFRGAAFVYDLSTGALLRTLAPSSSSDNDAYGRSVDLNDQYIIVGSPGTNQIGSGKIFLYRRSSYFLVEEFFSSNPSGTEAFGQVVKLEDDYILTSNFRNGDPERDVYVIDQFCRADINLDGSLNFLDVSAFLKLAIDFNEDGSFNFLDISAFLQSFGAGCP